MSNSPPPEDGVNYLAEMIKSPTNGWALAAGLIVGSVASIAMTLPGLIVLPFIAQAGANGIAALFMPESPVFRAKVDRQKRSQRREALRKHLIAEIDRRLTAPHAHWEAYETMRQQLFSLRQAAVSEDTTLSEWDVERMDDTTVNFLRLWLARLSIAERQASVDEKALAKQTRAVETQLAEDDLSTVDRNRLEKASDDLRKILARHQGFDLQETSLSASMMAIADGFSEVYHRVMANPAGEDLSSFLATAVERMDVTEELDFSADAEIEKLLGKSKAARAAAARTLAETDPSTEAARPARKASKAAARKAKAGK